jgi:peptidoglycan-associated lipoprotein
MTFKMISRLALVAAIGLTAACAKKEPPQLPPAPQDTPPPVVETPPPPPPSGPTPGSKEDFLAQAGSDRVLFALDAYDLDDQDKATLDAQALWLAKYPNVNATIEGHCDERGTREYNLALGDRRANAAKNYLVGKGVAAARLTTISYGKERPQVEGSDESAWAQNRRAVTVVLSNAGY